jgi:hypothetical protein
MKGKEQSTVTRYGQWKQRREEKARREKFAEEVRLRKEEQARIDERNRKLDAQTEFWKMRLGQDRPADEE